MACTDARHLALANAAASLVSLSYGAEPTAYDPLERDWKRVTCQTWPNDPHGDGCPWPDLIAAAEGG